MRYNQTFIIVIIVLIIGCSSLIISNPTLFLSQVETNQSETTSDTMAFQQPAQLSILNSDSGVYSAKLYKISNNKYYQDVTCKVKTLNGIYSDMREIYYMKVILNNTLQNGDILRIYHRVTEMESQQCLYYRLYIKSWDWSINYGVYTFNKTDPAWHWTNITLSNITTPITSFIIYFEHCDSNSFVKWQCDKIFGSTPPPYQPQWYNENDEPMSNFTVQINYLIHAGEFTNLSTIYIEIRLNRTYWYPNNTIWRYTDIFYVLYQTSANILQTWYSPLFMLPPSPPLSENQVMLQVGTTIQVHAQSLQGIWSSTEKQAISSLYPIYWH